jgi:hypothetical protein
MQFREDAGAALNDVNDPYANCRFGDYKVDFVVTPRILRPLGGAALG